MKILPAEDTGTRGAVHSLKRMRRTRILYYLLTAFGLVYVAYDFSHGAFVPTSALAAVLYAAVAIGLTLLILRKHPGIAHGVVWGIAVSSADQPVWDRTDKEVIHALVELSRDSGDRDAPHHTVRNAWVLAQNQQRETDCDSRV